MDTAGKGGVRSSNLGGHSRRGWCKVQQSSWTQSGRASKGLEVYFDTGRTVQGQAICLDTVGESGVMSSNVSEHSRMKSGWTQSGMYRSLLQHR